MTLLFLAWVASWIAVDLIGYWLHRWAHVPRSPLYRRHMTHHLVNYPPRRYLSTAYTTSGSDSLAIWFAPFGVLYCALAFVSLPWPLAVAVSLGVIPPAVINSVMHDLMHVDGSWAWRGRRRSYLSRAHYAHHRNMSKNFGVATLVWDRLFGTLWRSQKRPPDPVS